MITNLRGGIVIPIGTKIFAWEIIGEPESTGGGLRFPCQCVCGKKKIVLGKSLRDGDSKSCGCGQISEGMSGWPQPSYNCPYCLETYTSVRSLLLHIKQNHLQSGEKFCPHCRQKKKTKEFTSQDRLCKACRHENGRRHYDANDLQRRYKQAKSRGSRRGLTWDIPYDDYVQLLKQPCHYCGKPLPLTGVALDRKNNGPTYSLATVVPCCRRCNTVKSDHFTYEEMLELAETIKRIDTARRFVQVGEHNGPSLLVGL